MRYPLPFSRVLVYSTMLLLAGVAPARAALDAPVSPNAQPNVAQLLQFF
jgi:hypothetical protein